MIGHVSLYVKNFKEGKEFYNKVLPILGYHIEMESDGAIGFMAQGNTDFWLVESDKQSTNNMLHL